jgi:hypothetical protein
MAEEFMFVVMISNSKRSLVNRGGSYILFYCI